MAPAQGPGLIFSTLPEVFAAIPARLALRLAVLRRALRRRLSLGRRRVRGARRRSHRQHAHAPHARSLDHGGGGVFVVAIPPTINNAIFVPWDLTFGSGMQTLGALLAVLTVGWCHASVRRAEGPGRRRGAAGAGVALSTGSASAFPADPDGRDLVAADAACSPCPLWQASGESTSGSRHRVLARRFLHRLRHSSRLVPSPSTAPRSSTTRSSRPASARVRAAGDLAGPPDPDGRRRPGDDAGAAGEGRGRRRHHRRARTSPA